MSVTATGIAFKPANTKTGRNFLNVVLVAVPLATGPQHQILTLAPAIGVGALAIGGFTLSFTALRDLAQREFAIAPQLSFIYPLMIDGFIVVATAAAFTMKKHGPRVTWYPWAALAVFDALSVLGNAAHAIENPSATFPAWVSALSASVPAVALLIASHLLVVMINYRPTSHEGNTEIASPAASSASAAVTVNSPADDGTQKPPHDEVEPVLRLRTVGGHALLSRLEAAVAEGIPVTAALIAEFERVSERTGRRRVDRLRVSHPHLFTDERRELAE